MENLMAKSTFTEIVDAADRLSTEEQENLVDILQKRLRDRHIAELARDVREAQQEFAEGKCQAATPAQLMKEILS
jgi:transcriptional regulator of heat shock response